ncbi:MAG TPA: Hsp70 family protein [Polyangiales bacterium]|nr:Hsp70 family protein [Polyangiales bacterium]
MTASAKYAVGIDLGTTHCALGALALGGDGPGEVGVVPIPQVIAPGEVEARPLLPSFLYLPHESELPGQALALPWPDHPTDYAVGEVARSLGVKSALRLVSSAKSWLCHPGVDRRAAILPAAGGGEVPKISPLQASVRYLEHLRRAWDYAHPEAPLSEQLLTLAVPASFDPAARELTAEAARSAGLGHAVLLEEPQAALYSWLCASGEKYRDQVKPGDTILVLDLGGGTADFSVIAAREQDGELALERVAVGDHILLGGDNMDLALAHFLKAQLEAQGTMLDPAQLATLTQASRVAKEQLLGRRELASVPVVIPGRGSKLIGGSIKAELNRADLERVLLDGFLPEVAADARPQARARVALTQLGLPYAHDPALTRHLAAFLAKQAAAISGEEGASAGRPTAILFNGGVFKSPLLRERVLSVLNGWLKAAGAPEVRVLSGEELDLGVARGAAYYGFVRAGHGIRIRGGTAMAYYVGVESSMPAVPGLPPPLTAVCLAPFGLEEGSHADMPAAEFGLVVGEPVRFRFFGSSVRREDQAGTALDHWQPDELAALQDIEVTLSAEQHQPGDTVIVRLQAGVTEVGTLQLEAVARATGERWKVEFDTRDQAP